MISVLDSDFEVNPTIESESDSPRSLNYFINDHTEKVMSAITPYFITRFLKFLKHKKPEIFKRMKICSFESECSGGITDFTMEIIPKEGSLLAFHDVKIILFTVISNFTMKTCYKDVPNTTELSSSQFILYCSFYKDKEINDYVDFHDLGKSRYYLSLTNFDKISTYLEEALDWKFFICVD